MRLLILILSRLQTDMAHGRGGGRGAHGGGAVGRDQEHCAASGSKAQVSRIVWLLPYYYIRQTNRRLVQPPHFFLRGVVSALSKTSIRTSSPSLTYAYREVIVRNYDRLWGLRFQKKRAMTAGVMNLGREVLVD